MKYAYALDMPGEHAKWTLEPWKKKGLKFFSHVSEVPNDYILISSHHPPWRQPFKNWIDQGNNYIEIEYGYWGPDTPRRTTRRVTYNGHHNMNLRPITNFRSHLFPTPVQLPWQKRSSGYIIGIQPVEVILQERTGENLEQFRDRLTKSIRTYWDGEIRWRKKTGAKDNRWSSYVEQLSGAYAVVGERTMACTEACLLGIPGYTVDASMSTLLMGNIENLSNIQYPDRSVWWEHICWSQFNREEFDTTVPADLVEEYQIWA
jgi:hypothetical protein